MYTTIRKPLLVLVFIILLVPVIFVFLILFNPDISNTLSCVSQITSVLLPRLEFAHSALRKSELLFISSQANYLSLLPGVGQGGSSSWIFFLPFFPSFLTSLALFFNTLFSLSFFYPHFFLSVLSFFSPLPFFFLFSSLL